MNIKSGSVQLSSNVLYLIYNMSMNLQYLVFTGVIFHLLGSSAKEINNNNSSHHYEMVSLLLVIPGDFK